MIFPHTVIVHPSIEDTDSDGNAVRRPQDDGVPVRAFVQAVAAQENPTTPQAAIATWKIWLHPKCPPLDAFAILHWRGQRLELLGDAQLLVSPDERLDHWRATLRKAA